MEEEKESTNPILGNCLMELELRQPASEEVNNIPNTQPDLLQCSRADGIDYKLVDVVLFSKIGKLDNG